MIMTIKRFGTRFDIDFGDGRLHVLNPHSLAWNLVLVFGFSKKQAKQIVARLENQDVVKIERSAA